MEPWLTELHQGHGATAWDLFVERYRRLMVATIGRLVPDADDRMDVFAHVCQSLSANDFARLKQYSVGRVGGASVGAWLVTVVRHLSIDWLRRRDGRRRPQIPAHLSPLQREIFRAVCLDCATYVEAYEIIQSRSAAPMSFGEFLREARTTRRAAPCPEDSASRASVGVSLTEEHAAPQPALDGAETAELAHRIAAALALQPDDVRLAVELFTVEGMAAADVARIVGWPNDKTVYNRVYRALAALRATFERDGIGPGDLV